MAIGKNKKTSKGKKGGKKKPTDSFAKKDWYDIQVPSVFKTRNVGKTPVNRTVGTKIASDNLKGRVFEINQQDLDKNSLVGYNKFKFVCEDVQGSACVTNFHGMSVTTDRIWSLVKRGQTTIDACVDFKTKDGYYLRFLCVCFVARVRGQIKKNSYAKTSQVKSIRKIMRDTIVEKFSTGTVKNVMSLLLASPLADEITRRCKPIKQITDFTVKKVKVLKAPKTDLKKLQELHSTAPTKGEGGTVSVFEPPIQETV